MHHGVVLMIWMGKETLGLQRQHWQASAQMEPSLRGHRAETRLDA